MTVDFYIETLATITGILCVFLQTREDARAWPFGLIAVCLLSYIFFKGKLYSSALLNIIFIGLNLFGWWNWSRKDKEENVVKITNLLPSEIGIWTVITLAGTLAWGYFMASNTDAAYVYGDAFAIIASLVASYLLAQKKIENWLLWIIINVISIAIYYLQGLYQPAFLYTVYLGLGIKGFIDWRKTIELENQATT